MKYLKQFATTEEYNTYTADTNNFYAPNVSFINRGNKVEYHQYVPHDYVEIGGVKWATMNIGAESVTDYGLYFQWGDTAGYIGEQCGDTAYKKPFTLTDCVLHNGTSSSASTSFTKYNGNDGKTVLEPCDDAATLHWGGNWRMPTREEFVALDTAVNTAWTSSYNDSGVAGLVLTDKTDSSKVLFFPAAGGCWEKGNNDMTTKVHYWSSSLHSSVFGAYCIFFMQEYERHWQSSAIRRAGFPIRPVLGA